MKTLLAIVILCGLTGCQKAKSPFGPNIEEIQPYQVRALVLGKKNYRMDELASEVPTDLALGWGPLENPALAGQLQTGQANRRFWWLATKGLLKQTTEAEIIAHTANTHIIPANPEIQKAVASLRPGDKIYLQGSLVNLTLPNGQKIRTSLSRTDTGDGACEIFYVRKLTKIPN